MRDTIDMAREAYLIVPGTYVIDGSIDQLKAFEALVRADERSMEREAVEDLLREYDMVNSAFAKDFRARGETK